MPDKEKLKSLLKELQQVKLFEKIKKSQDYGLLVDILQGIIGKINLAKGEQGIRGEKGDKGEWGEIGKSGKDGKDGRDGKDGKDANKTIIIKEVLKEIPTPKDGLNGADGSPDQPEEIRNKLSSLDDEEKLPIEAIKDLEKELKKLRKRIDEKVVTFVGGGGVGKHNVVAYDLSDSLSADGSVRIFNLPAFWKIVSVNLSSFPNILRPDVDFTVSGSTLTFTAEIPAASISSPQTCIILYSE